MIFPYNLSIYCQFTCTSLSWIRYNLKHQFRSVFRWLLSKFESLNCNYKTTIKFHLKRVNNLYLTQCVWQFLTSNSTKSFLIERSSTNIYRIFVSVFVSILGECVRIEVLSHICQGFQGDCKARTLFKHKSMSSPTKYRVKF